jgi:hypothetical protein
MSWRYKLYNIEPEQVVTIDPINDNFQPYVEELGGALNAHNFREDAFVRSNFADDVAHVFHLSRANDVGLGLDGYSNPTSANWVTIRSSESWQSFTSTGLTLTFTAHASKVYLCASFNIHCGTNKTYTLDADGERVPAYRQLGYGYLVALRFDGTVLNETIIGSGDAGVDLYAARDFVFADSQNATLQEPQGGGGTAGARLPLTVDAVLDIVPGQHTVEVVVMNIKGSMRTIEALNTYIGQRELFALEMVR